MSPLGIIWFLGTVPVFFINLLLPPMLGTTDIIIAAIIFEKQKKRAAISLALGLFSFFAVVFTKPAAGFDIAAAAFAAINLVWLVAIVRT